MLCSVALWGCKAKKEESGKTTEAAKATAAALEKETAPPAYTYPAPVQGHFRDSDQNLGQFELVDGIAYADSAGAGVVVWVTAKPIASPLVGASACPMTEARSLSLLRDSAWAEVTLDAKGRSTYFAAGQPYDGSLREGDAGNPWASARKSTAPGRISGSVRHGNEGSFTFDFPVATPPIPQVSYGEAQHGLYVDPSTPKPSLQAIADVYAKLRDAAVKKDLAGILAAQGFEAKEITAIRGLDGIDRDVDAFADRFLRPGAGIDPDVRAGSGHLGAEGADSKGKKFYNYYYFTACGDRLLLTGIAVNAR